MLVVFLVMTSGVYADTIGIRAGYIDYSGGGSEYNDNGGFDSEITQGGIFFKREYDNWWVRLGYDGFKTGNEFTEHLACPYEAVDLKQDVWNVTIAKVIKWAYVGIGLDYINHDRSFVELYPGYTNVVEVDNAIGYHVCLGIFKELSSKWQGSLEINYLSADTDVFVDGAYNHTENVGNVGAYVGLEYRF